MANINYIGFENFPVSFKKRFEGTVYTVIGNFFNTLLD